MTRHSLEHVIRSASAIAMDSELIVFGSQAILGSFPDAPAELLVSRELDVYPKNKPEAADLIDSAIGEGSSFDETFGYYAHAVAPEVATFPAGWQERLVPVRNENTAGATGWCVEVHDLAASKLAAGRDKDADFVRALLRHGLASQQIIEERLKEVNIPDSQRHLLKTRLHGLAAEAGT